MLTDTDLRKIIVDDRKVKHSDEKLLISPFLIECLTPVGYDLRIGDKFASRKYVEVSDLSEKGELRIRSGDTVLVRTLERIEMPKNLSISGLISSKVSIVTKGITHISTTIDADWKGNLLITISNVSNETVVLKYGQPFCTAVFFLNLSAPSILSNHDESRNDILFFNWVKANRVAHKRIRVKFYFTLLVIPLFTILGWFLFKSAEGMSALGAVGVGIALLLKEKI